MSNIASTRPAVWIGAGVATLAATLIALYFGGAIGPRNAPPSDAGAAIGPENDASEQAALAPQPDTSAQTERDGAQSVTQPSAEARTTDAAAPAAPQAPSIDVFRLEPDGSALVAGRAAPGWQVTLLLDSAPLASFRPGADGTFAEFVDVPGSAAPRVLSLSMTGPDGGAAIAGETEIFIAPAPQIAVKGEARSAPVSTAPAPSATVEVGTEAGAVGANDAPAPASSGPAPAQQAAAAPATDQPSREVPDLAVLAPGSDLPSGTDDIAARPQTARVAQGDAAPEAKPAEQPAGDVSDLDASPSAPTVLMADAGGVRVLQTPGQSSGQFSGQSSGAAPEVMSSVALESISYSSDGAVQLSGRASGNGFVRVYLDNTPITTSRITEARTWRTDLPQVDTGIYTLRIDEVSPEGLVTSRVETPFKREDRALLAELRDQQDAFSAPDTPDAPAGGIITAPTTGTARTPQPDTQPAQPPIRAITVQPGNTLWAISRDTYGEGILYVRVFEANADRIRDPDLIYPGQVFELPQ